MVVITEVDDLKKIQEGYISPSEWRIPDSQIKVIGKDRFCITIDREIAFLSSFIKKTVLQQEREAYMYPNVVYFTEMPPDGLISLNIKLVRQYLSTIP